MVGVAGLRVVRERNLEELIQRGEAALSRVGELQTQVADLERQKTELQGLLNAATAKPLLQVVVDDYVGRAKAPYTADTFKALVRAYDMLDGPGRETASRALMSRLAVEPQLGELLCDSLSDSAIPPHELLILVQAAVNFARGRLDRAESLLRRAMSDFPSPLAYLSCGRTLQALERIDEAQRVLEDGLEKYPDHLYLNMELISLFGRRGAYAAANTYLSKVIHEFDEEHAQIAPLQKELDDAIELRQLQKDVDHDIYTDDFVTGTWWYYWRSYKTMGPYQDGNAGLDAAIRREVTKILKKDPGITTFIDFGAFCAYTIAKLAEEFPAIRFIGIDRPEIARDLNQRAFPGSNLEFVAGETLDYVTSNDLGARPVLYHTRTSCFCYPEYVKRLYAACYSRNVSQIICAEGTNLSRSHLKFYAQGSFPNISIAARGSTFSHDYKTLLAEAGYTLTAWPGVQPWLLIDDRSGFGSDHRIYLGERR